MNVNIMKNKTICLFILLLFPICVDAAMMQRKRACRSRIGHYERPQIEKRLLIPLVYLRPFNPDFPIEADMHLLRFIATNTGGETFTEAARIFNALTRSNKFLVDYMNDPGRVLGWTEDFSRKFEVPNILVVRMLWTKEARRRYALQESLIAGWGSGDMKIKDNFDALKKMGVYLEFSYDCCYPTPFLQTITTHSYGMPVVAQWLVDNGANINACTPHGRNAFMLLCNGYDEWSMNLVLDHKDFNVNHQDNKQDTALHWLVDIFAKHYHKDISIARLKQLLKKGANPTIKNARGATPLQLAYLANYEEELIDLLKDAEIDWNSKKNPDSVS